MARFSTLLLVPLLSLLLLVAGPASSVGADTLEPGTAGPAEEEAELAVTLGGDDHGYGDGDGDYYDHEDGYVDGEELYMTEDVVVTGTRTPKLLKDAPVKTELIRSEQIAAKGALNLIDALNFETGIKIDNACSLCHTTGVQISGVPSRYSLVMIDGIPTFSSLGATYGFNNISAADIAQVEVVKGPGSVLYGTDAMGGVINIITREPGDEPSGLLQLEGGNFGYKSVTGHGSFSRGDVGISLMANHTQHDPVDRDGDQVSEYAGYERTTLTGVGRVYWSSTETLVTRLSVLHEDRQGGGIGWGGSRYDVLSTSKRGLSETIHTNRLEGTAKYTKLLNWGVLDTSLALTYHKQDSDYEGEVYVGDQFMFYVQQNLQADLHPNYYLVTGASYRFEDLQENLFVNEYSYHIPGVYLQGDWRITDGLDFIHGARFDWHNHFGSIVTPRGVIRYGATDYLTFRGVVGTGFRAPTTFYEYAHGVRPTGAQYIMDDVKEERSVGGNLSVTADFGRQFNVTLEGGINRISDPISWSVDDNGNILVENASDSLTVYSSELQARSNPLRWLNLTAGYGLYKYDDPAGALTSASPSHQITAGVDVWLKKIGFRGSINGQIYSPMDLVGVYGPGYNALPGTTLDGWLDTANADLSNPKLKSSPWQALIGIRAEQRIWQGFSAYLGVDNLLDYHQSDVEGPLFFPAGPNGEANPVDVIHIWGPMRGRFIYGGIKMDI